jgi:hypothetical protein
VEVNFKNGSKIIGVDNSNLARGLRANIIDYWSDELGCFVRVNKISQRASRQHIGI